MLFGRRKFAIAMTSLVMTFVLALTGVVDGGNWQGTIGLIVGLYGVAEAAEGAAQAFANNRSA